MMQIFRYIFRHLKFRQTLVIVAMLLSAVVYAQCPQRYLDKVFSKVQVQYDIIYGGNRLNTDGTSTWLAFDLYEPKDDTVPLRPLVMLLHGGGFTNWPPFTRKSPDIVELANDLARRGYVVVSAEYRLFSGEATKQKMIETALAGAADIHDALCFLANSVGVGNPFRIDTSKVILGGVSAGGGLALNFGLFVDDTSMLSAEFRTAMDKVSALDMRNPQDVFAGKFCGAEPKGVISISAGLLDSTYIKYKPADVLLIHGDADGIIPIGAGYIYSDPSLPTDYGSGFIASRIAQTGMHVEFDNYPGLWHVPIVWNFFSDIPGAIIQTLLTGTIFNKPILDSTEHHMASFCYNVIGRPVTDCRVSGINNNIYTGQLNIAPNPASGMFTIMLPETLRHNKLMVEVCDLAGSIVYTQIYPGNSNLVIDLSRQSKGMYLLKISMGEKFFIDKLIIQ